MIVGRRGLAAAAAPAAAARVRLARQEPWRAGATTLPAITHPGALEEARGARRAEAKQLAPQYDQGMSDPRPASTSTPAAGVVTGGPA